MLATLVFIQLSNIASTMSAAVMAITMAMTNSGLLTTHDPTRKLAENWMQHACHDCTSMNFITEVSLLHTYQCTHGYKPGPREQRFLPLPASIQEEVSSKLSLGIPTKRVLQGNNNLLIKAVRKIQHSQAYPIYKINCLSSKHRCPQQHRPSSEP